MQLYGHRSICVSIHISLLPSLCCCQSLSLPLPCLTEFVFHSVWSRSLKTFWAEQGRMGSGFLRNSSPIIPRCLARLLLCTQHVHTYVNTCAYMRTNSCASWKSEESFVSLGRGDAHLSSVRSCCGQGLSVCLRLRLHTHMKPGYWEKSGSGRK